LKAEGLVKRYRGRTVVNNVSIQARCGEIVMSGPNDTAVQLTNKEDKIWGRKITIWLDDQRMVCVPARLTLIDSNPAKATGTDKNGEEKRVLP
jgi:hypothetical protein